jgi:hypothetical protein
LEPDVKLETRESLENTTFEPYEGLESTTASSWTGTFGTRETLETRTYEATTYDSTLDDATTFETRDAATFETRDTTQFDNAATAMTDDSLESVETYETHLTRSGEGIEQTMTQMNAEEAEKIEPMLDNNENLELRNIACAASNVTEASELTDKYGLNERDAKRGLLLFAADCHVSEGEALFGDKYHGLDASVNDVDAMNPGPEADEVPTSMDEAQGVTPDTKESLTVEIDIPMNKEENPLSPISIDTVNVFVPGEAEPLEDEYIQEAPSTDLLTVGTMSEEQLGQSEDTADNISLKANSDEGSLASLKKKEHGYEGMFQDQISVDKRMGHIGLILPFLSKLQCGAFMPDTSMLDMVYNEGDGSASVEEKPEEEPVEEGNLNEIPCHVANEEVEVADGSVASGSLEEQDDKENESEAEEDVVEYQIGEDGNVRVRINREDTSTRSMENSDNSSTKNLGDNDTEEKQTSQTSQQSDDEESPCIVGVISFPAGEDDSIPSNESSDERKSQTRKDKRVFKPLAFLRKRVCRASSIFGKSSKNKNQSKKQAKSAPLSPRLNEGDTLHDRVYHNNVPATQTRISTKLILDDLKIIEETAKVMYQDRFNSTSALLNPADEDVKAAGSLSNSKRNQNTVDASSHRSRATVESSLSPMFRSYFASDNN